MKAPRIAMMFLLPMVALCLGCGDDHESTCTPLQPTPVSTAKVELLFPNGGEYRLDLIIDIRWAASPEVVSFRVYYSSNRGGYWRDATSGRFIPYITWQWNPVWYPEPLASGRVYLVKVVGYDGGGNAVAEDVSDEPFAILVHPVF